MPNQMKPPSVTILGQIQMRGQPFKYAVPDCLDCPKKRRHGHCRTGAMRPHCDLVLVDVISHKSELQDTFLTLDGPDGKNVFMASTPLAGRSGELPKNQCFVKDYGRAEGLLDKLVMAGIVRDDKVQYETGNGIVRLATIVGVTSK